jgi:hypothetical protein
VNSGWREGWQADGDVFGAVGFGCAVSHPFARIRHDGLSGADVERSASVLDSKQSTQNNGDFFEFGTLARLLPAGRRCHAGDAHALVPRVQAPRELLNQFGLCAGGFDDRRL